MRGERRFRLIDEKFRADPAHYVLQTLLAFVATAAIVLATSHALGGGIVPGVVGASAFIVFAFPKHKTATPRSLVGGHLLCLGIGALCTAPLALHWIARTPISEGLLGAAAASLALFGMVITDSEHPPAAGNAVAFVVIGFGHRAVLFTVSTVVLLSLVRYALRNWLRELT